MCSEQGHLQHGSKKGGRRLPSTYGSEGATCAPIREDVWVFYLYSIDSKYCQDCLFWASRNPNIEYFSLGPTMAGPINRAVGRILSPWSKRERRDPLGAKQAENFQDPEISFGKLLLFYFMRSPRP